jgi:dsRNA-specific ribonuclease
MTKIGSTEDIPGYGRLEYLGDTVLDLVAAETRIRRCNDPDKATVSVNNEALQALSLELGFDTHIKDSPSDRICLVQTEVQ